MKVIVVDITGRNAAQYNPSLCKAIGGNYPDDEIILLCPTLYDEPKYFKWIKLLSFVPKSINDSSSTIKRILRAFDIILNYIFLIHYAFKNKPDIIHFQWLPFLEVTGIEKHILSMIKRVSSHTKIALTVHNIYPHEMDDAKKAKFAKRFTKIGQYIDGYMVHLNGSRQLLSSIFNIQDNRIFLTYHGIYEAKGYESTKTTSTNDRINIILYGYQTKYKGADILIEALKLMPPPCIEKIRTLIIGKSDMEMYSKYESIISSINTTWINKFVPEEELYHYIGKSDLILLPYRNITQSGVLLLALSYRKPVLTSDLPSFKETLEGYPDDYFFEAGNPEALKNMLMRFINGGIDINLQKKVIESLNHKYSWEKAGKSTMDAYRYLIMNSDSTN